VHYWGTFTLLLAIPVFLVEQTPLARNLLIGSAVFYLFSGLVSFLNRRKVICPLCKGTPLLSTRAHVHAKAFRIFPLDHGTTATLALIFTQTFRCMFCGSRFDLLKPKPGKHEHHAHQDSLS